MSSAINCDIISRRKTERMRYDGLRSSYLSSFMDLLCRVRKEMMYVLPWQTVSVLTRVLFWCLFPSLLRKSENKPKITFSWAVKLFVTRVHTLFSIDCELAIDSLWLHDAIWCHVTQSSLVQVLIRDAFMTMLLHENDFHITGSLCRESTENAMITHWFYSNWASYPEFDSLFVASTD